MPISTKTWPQYLKYVIQTDHPFPTIILNQLKTTLTDYQNQIHQHHYQYVDVFLIDKDITHKMTKLWWQTLQQEIKLLKTPQQQQCYQWLRQQKPIKPAVIQRCLSAEIRNAIMYNTNWLRLTVANYVTYCQQHPVNPDIAKLPTLYMYQETHIFEMLQFIEQMMFDYLEQIETQ